MIIGAESTATVFVPGTSKNLIMGTVFSLPSEKQRLTVPNHYRIGHRESVSRLPPRDSPGL